METHVTMKPYTVIYQAAKLGDVPYLLKDFEMARRLDAEGTPIGRIYGNASGALDTREAGAMECLLFE